MFLVQWNTYPDGMVPCTYPDSNVTYFASKSVNNVGECKEWCITNETCNAVRFEATENGCSLYRKPFICQEKPCQTSPENTFVWHWMSCGILGLIHLT